MIFVLVLIIIVSWLIGFIVLNDFSVPSISVKAKRILFVFPHPDDEISVGGLIKHVAIHYGFVSLAILTRGERGTTDGHLCEQLKIIRREEMLKSAENLSVTKLIHKDFGDGKLAQKKLFLSKYLHKLIDRVKPDLVITYDLSGLYGHEDHMVVSEIVTKLLHNNFPKIDLWYTTRPQKVIQMARLPEHMAKDLSFKTKRSLPTHKFFIGLNFIYKIKSILSHNSQKQSFRNPLPKLIPLWFVVSTQLFEYYFVTSANKK
ncbi:MAG: PIG-L family deacetylase [Candidatus Shapirobacteria bacterium]|jgi:LmbE family N-acetylglucosaminyl deacetylase